MKNCTTLEQSKILVDAGLDPKSADMSYRWTYCKEQDGHALEDWLLEPYAPCDESPDEQIPCWSTGALIDLLPSCIGKKINTYPLNIVKQDDSYVIEYNANVIAKIGFVRPTLVEALMAMISWIIENGYLEKYDNE